MNRRSNCCVGTQCLSFDQGYCYQWADVLFIYFLNEDHMIHESETSDFKQADPHNQTSAVCFERQFAQDTDDDYAQYCMSTLLRLEFSSGQSWKRVQEWTVKQRQAIRWPHSWAWLVVATLIFSFLRVASDKCWVLFPLATEKSRCGGVKWMHAYHSHSLADSD